MQSETSDLAVGSHDFLKARVKTLKDFLAIVLVSFYLILVLLCLLLMGKEPFIFIRPIIRTKVLLAKYWIKKMLRRRVNRSVYQIFHDSENCYTCIVPEKLKSDQFTKSDLALYENEVLLGPSHSSHGDIRTLGKGRLSHWGHALYFSSSDNTNPALNGRVYRISEK